MRKRTKAELEQILKALHKAPYFLETMLRKKKKCDDYTHRYTFGTITEEERKAVEEYFNEKEG